MTPSRVEENFAIFDFELTDEQMAQMTGIDRGHRAGPDLDRFNMVRGIGRCGPVGRAPCPTVAV